MSPSSAGSSSRTSRSKLYERYDVEVPNVSSSNANNNLKKWRGGWFKSDRDEATERQQQQLPPDQWTNIEMIRYIFNNSTFKSKLIAILVIMILSSIIRSTLSFHNNTGRSNNNDLETKRGPVMTKYGLRPEKMDPDSHKRSNPFAAPGHQSFMEGVLEVKRVKKRENPPPPPPVQNQQQQQQQKQESLHLETNPSQTQGKRLPQQTRKQAPEKRAKGRKMPSD
ncbi:hypothetical protein QTG54_006009 [Skeletonema marinoi]|uniref:Uncharacterized protein n=1 Tax=Skeletonema marinoi TaxID=267567 RepID=A0AAD8YCP3_9STRA|nr:hypothetical protein QTG54_006009 [Skeletonema marinoi]